MYDNAYRKAKSLADMITSDALEKRVDVADPEIGGGLMSSTRRAFDEYARTLAGDSGGSDILGTTKQAPEDMNADYISKLRTDSEAFVKKFREGGSGFKSMGSPIDEETVRQGAEDFVARASEVEVEDDVEPVVRGDNALAVSPKKVESIIRREAKMRNIDPDVAVRLWQHEGGSKYQSEIKRSGGGSLGGKEASFGPFQLFTGGGMGNDYEQKTGRNLLEDNNLEGITTQIQFALDMATQTGWTPWYGRGPAGISKRQGLAGSKPVFNWKNNK